MDTAVPLIYQCPRYLCNYKKKCLSVINNVYFFFSDATVPVPSVHLCATRGQHPANQLLQWQRRCSWLVINKILNKTAFGVIRKLRGTLNQFSVKLLHLHICIFTCLCLSHVLTSWFSHLRFYMYKLPKEHGRKAPYLGEFYLLLEKGSDGWTNGKGTVNDTTGALGRTVGQLYSQGKVCRHHSPNTVNPQFCFTESSFYSNSPKWK